MILALILTVILECAVLYFLGERDKVFYLYWCALTAATNILVNLYILFIFEGEKTEYWITVAILELLVFAAECFMCFIYKKDKVKSIVYSAICNGTSFLVGLIIQLLTQHI